MEECDQENLSLSDKFEMRVSRLDTYFLEVCAHTLLKIAIFSEAKTEEYD